MLRSLLLLLALLLALPAGADPAAGTLVIGKVSDNPRKHYRRLKPMVDYAVAQLGDLGIKRGEVLMARTNAEMVELLKSGRVDWVTETVFSAVQFEQEAGAELLLVKWKKGVPEYRTVFITREDSPIRTLADLRGRVLALEDPGSTTAYYVPMAILLEHELRPLQLESARDPVPPGRVGFAFARGELNIATWVYRGLADAGAYNDLDWITPDHTPEPLQEGLRIFHESKPYPRAVELVRGDLDPTLVSRLREVLIGADEDPQGRHALAAYQRTLKLEPIDDEALAQLDEVRRLYRRVGAHVR